MTDFRIDRAATDDGSPIVALHGEVDIAAADLVEAAIRDAFGSDGASKTVVVDLRAVTFLDSSGLRALLGAQQGSQAEERRIVLVRGAELVQRVFRITGLEEQFVFVDDPADAARG